MHLAKGLEFRAVAVAACDDEVLPLQSRIERIGEQTELDEVYTTERHLLYVACTRARDHLPGNRRRPRLRIPRQPWLNTLISIPQQGAFAPMIADDGMCKIWPDYAANIITSSTAEVWIDSSRAGGRYSITLQVPKNINRLKDTAKARLTTILIDQRRQGNMTPEVTQSLLDMALNKRPLEVPDRAERLLRYLADCSQEVGQPLALYASPNVNPEILYGSLAWSESTTNQEVKFLLEYLTKHDWITEPGSEVYVVTVDGYRRISDSKTNPDSAQAFVAMWFGTTMDDFYENGVKPAIELSGYKPMRIDRKADVNKIDDEIVAEIRRSRFLVADFTHGSDGARGGVYFEAGFAFGLGIPVIYTCRHDMVNEIHFDTRQYHHTLWNNADDLRETLMNRIVALVGEGPNLGR